MTDVLKMLNNESVGVARRPNGYSSTSAREVRARASFTDQEQTEQERLSLHRLNNVLTNGQPLHENVPRGYYLNIEI